MGNTAGTRRRRDAQQRANNGLNGATFVQPTYQQPPAPHAAGHYPGAQPQYHIPPSHPGLGLGPHAHQYYPPPPNYYPPPVRQVAPAKNSAVHNTSTVRNLVNLKKPTLTVTPVEGKPHLLRVSFKFDATSACCVSVFPMAHEEGRDGKVVSKSTVGKRVPYEKGWNLVFPPEDLEDADLYCIDTQVYQNEQLQHANMSTSSYPLIIRLETLGDRTDAPEGTQLSDLEVGCAQPAWLQSQTTYVVLGEEGRQAVAKVIKQKIWVGGSSYELQEIYGLSMEASSSGGGDGDTSTECVVCLTNPKNTTVIPCRHFCMCSDCAKALLNQSRKCPMCRLNITSVLQINIGNSSRPPAAK